MPSSRRVPALVALAAALVACGGSPEQAEAPVPTAAATSAELGDLSFDVRRDPG